MNWIIGTLDSQLGRYCNGPKSRQWISHCGFGGDGLVAGDKKDRISMVVEYGPRNLGEVFGPD